MRTSTPGAVPYPEIVSENANPVGRAPAKYRVYGSDEKGFTVHDAPYEIKLGETEGLTTPFPANFAAEVAGHFEEVAGVAAGLLTAGADRGRVTGRQG